ncbi:MAG: TonB-dependent receptor [Chitinophagaceae bacterium]|nr:TonB-dependent receptor [Chitinophagaceae bacterium]
MRKITSYLVTILLANLFSFDCFAQNVTISGNVKNSSSKEAAAAVSITVKGAETGTFTSDKGDFKITVKNLPATLIISSVGYELREVTVTNAAEVVNVELNPTSSLGQEVVVSASRVPQKILESPVSIERVSAANIRSAPAASFYDVLSTLKGVDVTTSSLTFKTPTTRGFNGSGAVRVNQIVDGMDNQAPGLNFAVGGIIGLTELDVDNIELLPGASSALYGPGGMNGTILINSKNPFKYQGLSFQVKTGIMNTDKKYRDVSPYHNWSVRWAKKVSDKFAFKISSEVIAAKDWLGYDERNYLRRGTDGELIAGDRATDPNYDGINVYGDETTTDIRAAVLNSIGASAAPFLKNFIDTLNNGGGSTGWFSTYAQTYLGARLGGQTDFNAHTAARTTADIGRPKAGTPEFQNQLDAISKIPISKGGGLFVDKTNLYMTEGQYNLSHLTGEFADIIVGANFKRYALNSEGTLFADSTGKIGINEFGAYIQASKALAEDRVKLTVSGRYDKNQNFKGRFTPRATALIKVANNNNVRLSYQTAYRFPSTQQQWINLNVGSNTRLLGGNKDFQNFFGLNTNTYLLSGLPTNTSQYQFEEFKPESVSTFEVGYKGLVLKDKLLIDAYSYFGQYQDFLTRTLLIQPNSGNVNDVVAALANNVPVSNVGKIFSIPVNSTSKVKTFGFGLGIDYRLPANFAVGVNVSSDELKDVPAGFRTFFSTPKYRTNLSVSNSGFGFQKRLGFNVGYRWQEAFFYESDFTNGTIPAIHTVDAQISYKFPSTKSILKLGANNLLNQYYNNGVGNSIVGGLYYIGFGYNIF